MSSNLIWRRAVIDSDGDLSTKMKFLLRKRFGETINTVVCHDDMDYFIGLRDAGIKEAQEIIDAINEHNEILLKEEF